MKKVFFYPIIACVFMLNTASTCSSDDDNTIFVPTAQQAAIAAVNGTVTQGTWRITNFNEDGDDHTAQFSGYNFTFGASNTLTANNGSNNYTGVWSVTSDDNSNDDNPSNDIDFNIAFTSPANFAELTEDYQILERTTTLLRLQHISGGNGGTDLLTFQKN